MGSSWKHPAVWITILLGVALAGIAGNSGWWTTQRLADVWRRELSQADDLRAVELVQRLGRLEEAALPHLVQLLDDDRITVRNTAQELLREKLLLWLREHTPQQQQWLGRLAHELATQPLPRETSTRAFVKHTALKLLRCPADAANVNSTQLLLDCTEILQHLSEMERDLAEVPPENSVTVSFTHEPLEALPPEINASEPIESAPIPQVPPEEPLADPTAPPVLPMNGEEKLIPPARFFPDTPRRFREAEMHLNDGAPLFETPPPDLSQVREVVPEVLQSLNTRAVIRHLHGLPALAQAAEMELRLRKFDDATLVLARRLDDPDPQTRLQLVESLPYAKQLDAAGWLFELTNDPDARVRTAARNLLSTSRNPFTQRRLGETQRR